MMKFGAVIPLDGVPFSHNPDMFPTLPDWQKAAALEVVYQFVKEGKVLGPFPGSTRNCPSRGGDFSSIHPSSFLNRRQAAIGRS